MFNCLSLVEHYHQQFLGNSHKEIHAECTCSAFRPFPGVLPHHFQGTTIHHSDNFYLITERSSKNHVCIQMLCAPNFP